MKKIVLAALIFVAFCGISYAQSIQTGISGGYLNVEANNNDENGFYAGLYIEAPLSNSFALKPSLLYGNVSDNNLLYFPVVLKYYLLSNLSVQAGPQATYIFDIPNSDFKDRLGLDLSIGAGLKLLKDFTVSLDYGFKIAKNSETFQSSDFNSLMIGLSLDL